MFRIEVLRARYLRMGQCTLVIRRWHRRTSVFANLSMRRDRRNPNKERLVSLHGFIQVLKGIFGYLVSVVCFGKVTNSGVLIPFNTLE
jgi:hypothetical protein